MLYNLKTKKQIKSCFFFKLKSKTKKSEEKKFKDKIKMFKKIK